jgi:hypothetical protein
MPEAVGGALVLQYTLALARYCMAANIRIWEYHRRYNIRTRYEYTSYVPGTYARYTYQVRYVLRCVLRSILQRGPK